MEKDVLNKKYRLLVIGGSAGSLGVLFDLLPRLRPAPSLSIVIVVHRRAEAGSQLAGLFASLTYLPVKEPANKEPVLPGTVYLAPADFHLLIGQDQTLYLDQSPKVHYCRPSINCTFQTAAEVYGPSAACLLLSGANEDGTAGLIRVKEGGGLTMAQDPSTAEIGVMPRTAIESGAVERILKTEEIAGVLNSLFA
jgi:two-component system, chemotaxis family, protein-glutamate methylesterase/glutaminase